MDNATVWEPSSLVQLLSIGEEQTRRLEIRLQDLSSSDTFILNLAQEIRSIFTRAITVAKLDRGKSQQACNEAVAIATDSPYTISDSPDSDTSEVAFKDNQLKAMPKKRKTQPKWTNQVQLVAGPGAEGPMGDGYSWRKYGQKEILGAKYPRSNYRCTHRSSKNCVAMKQVQRCETDPSVFDVTYRGEHTCRQKIKMTSTASQPKCNNADVLPDYPANSPQLNQPQQFLSQYQHDQDLLQSYKTSLKVKTEGLGSVQSTPLSCPVTLEHGIFSAPPTLENQFIDSFSSPTFISPATPESIFFSQCEVSNFDCCLASVHATESEVVNAFTSATSSPGAGRHFMEFPRIDDSDLSPSFEMPHIKYI